VAFDIHGNQRDVARVPIAEVLRASIADAAAR
jgi:hypothetical protein